ncbi:MAG: hypothetical protein ACRCVJ_13185 [Clostridium sp.]|uniref:hypothetical protein n=1 Tax=Clostridium sp. TaxID=1506 RepID=UPI003F32B29D
MLAKCDKCNFEFEPKQEIEKVNGDIRRVYFICPNCGEKYIAYYLSSKVEQKQDKIRKLIVKLNTYFKGTDKGEMYLEEYDSLNKEIKEDMQNLRKRFGNE